MRKDVARNRGLILRVARSMVDEGAPLQLNAVARAAEVGVGTVYRHFRTPEALLAALAEEQFEALIGRARKAADTRDVRASLREFLEEALAAYVADDAFAAEVISPGGTTERARGLREELLEEVRRLLAAAVGAGAARPELGPADLLLLLCGTAYAVKHHPRAGPAVATRYLDALLEGVFPR
ncbi:TetR family transcriptional regulator [Amycolatopsis acidicola]|uniref:TetR family transcriptional regulator n=1 Tax=Amycolatopsis acidicola TaxID=2596893 RepID=A0A5N0UJR1_9PSEU|nr:TetR family transcriptional regulator [Amycolatopsis acidicola]KAA9148134.1 TetR family transcriptional regulator [Amycolatopsis acidicola]